jgi:hypothetical protein
MRNEYDANDAMTFRATTTRQLEKQRSAAIQAQYRKQLAARRLNARKADVFGVFVFVAAFGFVAAFIA